VSVVLAIEDNADVLRFLRYGATGRGIEVIGTASYEEAVKMLDRNPDVLWCDVELPGPRDGTDILAIAPRSIPVIICTGFQKPSGIDRYWKFIPKGRHSGKYGAAVILQILHASRMLMGIKHGHVDPTATRQFSLFDSSFIGDSEQEQDLSMLFLQETNCLEAWASGDKDDAILIASGLLDGSLC
jgi:CheY-like chemotaxis protein